MINSEAVAWDKNNNLGRLMRRLLMKHMDWVLRREESIHLFTEDGVKRTVTMEINGKKLQKIAAKNGYKNK